MVYLFDNDLVTLKGVLTTYYIVLYIYYYHVKTKHAEPEILASDICETGISRYHSAVMYGTIVPHSVHSKPLSTIVW